MSDLRSRVAAMPGVTAVTSARAPSDNGATTRRRLTERRRAIGAQRPCDPVYYTWVQPNYFETLGIPLSRGRGFRRSRRAGSRCDRERGGRATALARAGSDRPELRLGTTASSMIRASCCPTVRRGRSSGWLATRAA